MPALREVFAEYDIEFDRRRNLRRGNRAVSATKRALTRLRPAIASTASALTAFAALAGGAAAAGLYRIVSSTTESIRELDRWSGRLGINRDALQSWIGLGAEYGADIDDVTDALKELQLKAQDAITGGTSQAEMFERIGISLDDLRPIVDDSDRLMQLFIGRLGQVESQALRNFTVDELMSDAGTRMNRVFALGNDEIARRRAAVNSTLGSTESLTRQVVEHTRRVVGLTRRWTVFKREVTARVLPIVTRLGERLVDLLQPLRDIILQTNLLKGALIGVGVVAAVVAVLTVEVWAPVVVALLAAAAAVGVVAVAYDQLSRTMEGGDTAIRRFIDAHLGLGATTGAILILRDAWQNYWQVLDGVWTMLTGFLSTIWDVADGVAAWLPQLMAVMGFLERIAGFFSGIARAAGLGFQLRAAREQERLAAHRDVAQASLRTSRTRRARAEREETAPVGEHLDAFGYPISRQARRPAALPRRGTPSTPTSISAPMSIELNVNEATDTAGIQRLVSRTVERAQERQIRALESMHQLAEAES